MPDEKRRVLTSEEKAELLAKHNVCYICLEPLVNYSSDEIEFDHIYSYADGHSQELSNFAPVHASEDPRKRNCHRAKGRKSPYEYREELRITTALQKITGLKDLCPSALPSVYDIANDKRTITFNGEVLPLYDQRIGNKDNYYFFQEIDTKFIENDEQIQLRPLEPKILPLIFNLKQAVQLLPSLGRLDPNSRTVKIFDGQHKAVAQIVGNNRHKIQCIVFVHPDVDELRIVIYQAHTDFVQQRYKKSHIDAKLADIYSQRIEAFRKQVGDPNARYSEAAILKRDSKATTRQFLMASIIEEVGTTRPFVQNYAAEDRAAQKQRPVLWQSIERAVKTFCNLEPVDKYSDDPANCRADEVENFCFILDQIETFSLKGKWEPDNPDSKTHQLARTYFYRTAFNNWIEILEEAFRFALEQMKGAKVYGALCYREEFLPEARARFIQIARKLFEHPLWVQQAIQEDIALANQDAAVADVFKREGLDYIYLTKL
jgi:hypothetical protein